MADDRPQLDFDIETDEGLEAYVLDLAKRKGIPERLRYPETPEAYAAAIAEVRADPRRVPWEKARAWLLSLGSDNPLPRPEPE